jgi:hypothetical protein
VYTAPSVREATAALADLLRDTISPPLSPTEGDTTAGVHVGLAPDDLPGDSLGVHPYAVIYPDPGADELRFTRAGGALTVTWQITCAGGTPDRCLAAVDRVRAALASARVEILGGPTSGVLAPPPGYRAGPVRRDPSGAPGSAEQPRHAAALQYQGTFTTGPVGS